MRMPWGKHRGKDLEDIECSYLFWVMETCNITRALSRAIQAELVRRVESWAPHVDPPKGRRRPRESNPWLDGTINSRLGVELIPHAEEILKAGFRAVAHRVHPDKGGDDEVMKLVLQAKEALERYIRGE